MAKQRRRAVSYLRVSSRGQVKGHGLSRQRAAIAEYCKRSKIELVEEFTDPGVSGTKPMSERPGLTALLGRIADNNITLLLIEQASRLGRDLIETEVIIRELTRHGVEVVTADNGNNLTKGDDSDPTNKLIRQVLGAVSEFEKSALVMKLRAARQRRRRETGSCEGAKAFGYFEREPETLERIHKLNRKPRGEKRRSAQRIADILNEEKLASRSGKPWTRGMVRSILLTAKS